LVKITVLGKSPAWQDAGGACSGYLVEEGDTVALLDCGNGVFSKLREARDYLDVDAIFISHLHADHFFDLIPYAYALLFSPRRIAPGSVPAPSPGEKPKLYAPPGSRAVFDAICKNFHDSPLIEFAFDLHEYDPSDTIAVGSLRVQFTEVPHWVQTCAMRVSSTANGSGNFTFGADCAPSQALIDFAQGTDLVMLESTLLEPETQRPRGHLCAGEAGEHAAKANAGRLVLTHISDELDAAKAKTDAATEYDGDVHMAVEGDIFEV
jgi:ribonuclease BN (tRNA processing enzyme)